MKEIDSKVGATDWHFMTPQLPVHDVRETQAYYRDILGCKVAWIYDEEYGAVYNGRTEIFFSRQEGPIAPSCHFIRVENADRMLEWLREKGARIVGEIASHPWGMREFTIEDLNGHQFRIGHSDGPVIPKGTQAPPEK